MSRKLFRRKFCRKIVAPVAAAMSCVSVSNVSRAKGDFDPTQVMLGEKVIKKFKENSGGYLCMDLSDFCSKVLPSIYVFPSSRLKAIKEMIKKYGASNLNPNADVSLKIEVDELSSEAYGTDVLLGKLKYKTKHKYTTTGNNIWNGVGIKVGSGDSRRTVCVYLSPTEYYDLKGELDQQSVKDLENQAKTDPKSYEAKFLFWSNLLGRGKLAAEGTGVITGLGGTVWLLKNLLGSNNSLTKYVGGEGWGDFENPDEDNFVV